MKHILLVAFFLIGINKLISQNEKEYYGFIKLNDSSVITYSVNFIEKNGKISGYSLTDLGGLHESKSNIKGKYNENEKTLTFNEYDIVYTKSPITQDDFCFVNFKGKNINLKKNQKFKGEFKGLFSDKTQCINGEIYLSPVEKIEKQMKKANKVIQRTNRIADSLKEKANPLKIMDTLKMNVLRKSETLSVFSKFKTIRLEIYDGGQEDGDKIDVLNNGELILKDYEIISKRKPISILLAKAKTSIVLKAKNVGSMSTNTAVLEFFIGDQKIRALTNLKAGEATQIDVYLKE